MKNSWAENKILATKLKNSQNYPNTFYRMQNRSNVIRNNSYKKKKKIILTKYKKF